MHADHNGWHYPQRNTSWAATAAPSLEAARSGPPPPPPVVRAPRGYPPADSYAETSAYASHSASHYHPYYQPRRAPHPAYESYLGGAGDPYHQPHQQTSREPPSFGQQQQQDDSTSFYHRAEYDNNNFNRNRRGAGNTLPRGGIGRKRRSSIYGADGSSSGGTDGDTAYSSASSYGRGNNRLNRGFDKRMAGNDNNDFRGGDAGSYGGNSTIRLLMQGKEVGSIIGKEGRTIKRIRDDSSCRINISDSSAPERIVTLLGSMPTILKAFSLICQKFDEDNRHGGAGGGNVPHANGNTDAAHDESAPAAIADAQQQQHGNRSTPPLTIRLLVPSSQCGSIIGKGGEKIKFIRESTGVSIQVNTDVLPNSTERCVTVSGSVDAMSKCFEQVTRLMSDSPPKGPVIQYRPLSAAGKNSNNNNNNGHHNSGGGNNNNNNNGLQLSPHAAASLLGANGAAEFLRSNQQLAAAAQLLSGGGGGGPGFPHPSNAYGQSAMMSPHAAAAAAAAAIAAQHHAELAKLHQLQHLLGPGGGGGRNPNNAGNSPLSASHSPTTNNNNNAAGSTASMTPLTNGQVQQEMAVPNELIGCVIGRGGAKIQEIRNMSGAMIKISPSTAAAARDSNKHQQSPNSSADNNNSPGGGGGSSDAAHNNSKDRLVTITGRPEAVQLAAYMIQNRISQEQASAGGGDGHSQQQQQQQQHAAHNALAAFNAVQSLAAFSPTLIHH